MAYYIEIKETSESKSLVEHLRSLKYVKVEKHERKTYDVGDLVAEIKKSEKSKRISWADAKKQMASWK
jgi:hypothetical protein